nr:hypothetical protein [Tanacetum cinerariifolium]
SELVSSEVMEIVIPEVGGIKVSNDNPTLFYDPIISGTPSNLTPSGEKVLFDAEYESDSSDDQSCSDEDVLEKIVSKHLSEEENIPMESLRTHDYSLPISSKIDSLLKEFDDDYDSGRDISILEELLDNYSLSFPVNELYHFDIPSPYRPPAKPPDGNTGTL